MLPGRKFAFRAGFCPDCYRESTDMGRPAGRRPAEGPNLVISCGSPTKISVGKPIYGPEALLRNTSHSQSYAQRRACNTEHGKTNNLRHRRHKCVPHWQAGPVVGLGHD
jgi:hypothetical protein